MLRVRCQANVTVDAKGRLALPAPIRRALTEAGHGQLVLTFYKGSVWGWTVQDFEETVQRRVDEADPFDQDVQDFTHSVLAPAQDVDVDGQGRIRIPALLRQLGQINKEVVVHSVARRLEIWDRTTWEARFRQSLDRTATTSGMPGRGS